MVELYRRGKNLRQSLSAKIAGLLTNTTEILSNRRIAKRVREDVWYCCQYETDCSSISTSATFREFRGSAQFRERDAARCRRSCGWTLPSPPVFSVMTRITV